MLRESRNVSEHRGRADFAGPLRVQINRAGYGHEQVAEYTTDGYEAPQYCLMTGVGGTRPDAHPAQIVSPDVHSRKLRIGDRKSKETRKTAGRQLTKHHLRVESFSIVRTGPMNGHADQKQSVESENDRLMVIGDSHVPFVPVSRDVYIAEPSSNGMRLRAILEYDRLRRAGRAR